MLQMPVFCREGYFYFLNQIIKLLTKIKAYWCQMYAIQIPQLDIFIVKQGELFNAYSNVLLFYKTNKLFCVEY